MLLTAERALPSLDLYTPERRSRQGVYRTKYGIAQSRSQLHIYYMSRLGWPAHVDAHKKRNKIMKKSFYMYNHVHDRVQRSSIVVYRMSHDRWHAFNQSEVLNAVQYSVVFSLHWCAVYSAGQYWILARANIQYWPAEYTVHQERKTTSTSTVPHTK